MDECQIDTPTGTTTCAQANKWNYLKYDGKNRPISQGIYTGATNNVSNSGSRMDIVSGSITPVPGFEVAYGGV